MTCPLDECSSDSVLIVRDRGHAKHSTPRGVSSNGWPGENWSVNYSRVAPIGPPTRTTRGSGGSGFEFGRVTRDSARIWWLGTHGTPARSKRARGCRRVAATNGDATGRGAYVGRRGRYSPCDNGPCSARVG